MGWSAFDWGFVTGVLHRPRVCFSSGSSCGTFAASTSILEVAHVEWPRSRSASTLAFLYVPVHVCAFSKRSCVDNIARPTEPLAQAQLCVMIVVCYDPVCPVFRWHVL